MSNETLLEQIRQNIIGDGMAIETAFGLRPLIYADYTASGRSLQFIEEYLQQQILPYYANTHSESSLTGRQTTAYREQARQLIKHSVNAADHQLIFTGSGATSAINKFIDLYGLRQPETTTNLPVVFISSYEHHSNELPWREAAVDLVVIPLTAAGQIDLTALEQQLQHYQDRPRLIGSFSAASNVTGVKSNVKAISALLHRYGAIACWDYAAAAPYVDINAANTLVDGDNSLDVLFISPHKFVGGPGTPGILLVKPSLLTSALPALPGGGTVSWVAPHRHDYLPAGERREEGGTPAIIESIRAGLVFQLKDQVGAKTIEALEHQWINTAMQRLSKQPNIQLLAGEQTDRLAILSFTLQHQQKQLHYGFVVALLNDLFGIQARGGCSCAGPYAHWLLDIPQAHSDQLASWVQQGWSLMRPGWIRINFNYFIPPAVVDYLLTAIELIAEHGWKLLSHYHYLPQQGVWRYREQPAEKATAIRQLNLFDESQTGNLVKWQGPDLPQLLQDIRQQLLATEPRADSLDPELPGGAESLRWFLLPSESQN